MDLEHAKKDLIFSFLDADQLLHSMEFTSGLQTGKTRDYFGWMRCKTLETRPRQSATAFWFCATRGYEKRYVNGWDVALDESGLCMHL